MIKYSLAVLCLLIPISSFSESRSYDRVWLGLFNKTKVSKSYHLWTEGQARMNVDPFTNQQLLLRFGILRPFLEKSELGFLYAYVQTGEAKENRLTLQLAHIFFKDHPASFQFRQRFEARKLQDDEALSIRARSFFRFQEDWFLVWDEFFLNLTNEEWTGDRFFERNRFFLGLVHQLPQIRFETGYLYQYTPRASTSIHEHIFAFSLFY